MIIDKSSAFTECANCQLPHVSHSAFRSWEFLELHYSIISISYPIYAAGAGEVVMYENIKLGEH